MTFWQGASPPSTSFRLQLKERGEAVSRVWGPDWQQETSQAQNSNYANKAELGEVLGGLSSPRALYDNIKTNSVSLFLTSYTPLSLGWCEGEVNQVTQILVLSSGLKNVNIISPSAR